MMQQFLPIYKKEFYGYFRTPVAYVFIVIFLLAVVGCPLFLGNFIESNNASLNIFFTFHPWLYLFLIPAIGMKLWSEELRSGTIELLCSLPIKIEAAVIAKFAAAWSFIGIALLLTFPMLITVNYLGKPDNAVIFSGYLGSFLLAGAYLSIASLTSAATKNQIISFIMSVLVTFILLLFSWGVFTKILVDIFPVFIIEFLSYLGFMSHYDNLSRGLIGFKDILYFASVMVICLTLTTMILHKIKVK